MEVGPAGALGSQQAQAHVRDVAMGSRDHVTVSHDQPGAVKDPTVEVYSDLEKTIKCFFEMEILGIKDDASASKTRAKINFEDHVITQLGVTSDSHYSIGYLLKPGAERIKSNYFAVKAFSRALFFKMRKDNKLEPYLAAV